MPRMELLNRSTRLLIVTLMCISAMLIFFIALVISSERRLQKYVGTWKVDFGVDNSAYSKNKLGLGTNTAIHVDAQDAEIVVTPDRLFFVTGWKTVGYEILEFNLGDESKLKLRDLNSGVTTFAILKRTGPRLALAFVDSNDNQIDESASGNQVLYTAQFWAVNRN